MTLLKISTNYLLMAWATMCYTLRINRRTEHSQEQFLKAVC